MQSSNHVFFWFRRDLRLYDNRGLYEALNSGKKVIPIFIFDRNILDDLEKPLDQRVQFIHQQVISIQYELRSIGADIFTAYAEPLTAWNQIFEQFGVADIYTNRDYEPYAMQRDQSIAELCESFSKKLISFKDQVIFEKDEIIKADGTPYVVYTPYMKQWKTKFQNTDIRRFPSEESVFGFVNFSAHDIIPLTDMDFEDSSMEIPSPNISDRLLTQYEHLRDYPAESGTTHIGVHLRFGTVSIRSLFRQGMAVSEKFTNELIWREFYMQILWHFPHVVNHSFRAEYDRIQWVNNEDQLEKWKEGMTGYPIVDAGMRELNATGYMHNRVRMIVASFLTKHLLIDWRLGEAWFAKKLLDFELSSNNGGWQWAAGCGVDAAPYFRIFNPYLQTKKFDPELKYIRKWVPEYRTSSYPPPIVDHEFARKRCLEVYQKALSLKSD